MKLSGSILIILAFGFFGVFKAYALNKRCKNLLELKSVLEALKTEIVFLKKDLSPALISASEKHCVYPLFYDFAKNIKALGIDDAWYKSLEKNSPALYFSENEQEILKKLSHGLGKTDAENQLRHLDFILTLISDLYDTANTEYKLKGNIYKSTGVSLGVLTVLLLI